MLTDITSKLYSEIYAPHPKTFARDYYMGLGYLKDLCAPIPVAKANAFASLLTSPLHVYENDLIAGSLRGLLMDVTPGEMKDQYDEIAKWVPVFGEKSWINRRDHYAPAYDMLLERGIGGILSDIEASKKNHAGEQDRVDFLESCRISMEAFSSLIRRYAEAANSDAMRETLASIELEAPKTFRAALQLVWLSHIVFNMEGLYAMAFGRIDQYLYPFYRRDVEAGILDDDEATLLLENTFMKIAERASFFGGDDVCNICIGGETRDGEDAVNGLTYCVLHAVGNCNIPGPNLSARVSKKNPDAFLPECLKIIGKGLGYPSLMNNEVNVAALERMGYETRDARNFCMVGCIENFIPGSQPPWTDGRFDVPKYLEYTLNRGRDMLTGKPDGLDLGPLDRYDTMAKLMEGLKTQLCFGAASYCARMRMDTMRFNTGFYVHPFMSCLTYKCVERGRDICDGGAIYKSAHGAACMGIGTITDSLSAIEKTVYIDKTLTLDTLVAALKANFEGYEDVRALLLNVPKYGNNCQDTDKYAVWYVDFLSAEFDRYRLCDGGRFYIGIAANTSNIGAGMNTAATPDGRLAHEPLSDAASPTYGKDTHGATSTVLSLMKPDYTKVALGTVVNQKFTPSMFRPENIGKLASLIRVYFAGGGQQMQINSVSRETLTDAMNHPENYASLVVRVSGFSAYYTRLDKSVQHDILNRTEHSPQD